MRALTRVRPLLPLLALFAILGGAAAAYYPGLGGPMLLDDLSALPKLGAYGPVDNPTTFVSYVTDGIAGPTGRPLAMASFLMDAHDWPANPWPFKLTNVLLHLLDGVLLALLLRLLSRAVGLDPGRATWAGVIGAGLWVLHPLFVSTTLYIVQRMAQMAALFVIGGLVLYTQGRWHLRSGRRRSGYALMAGGLVGGTLLGVLSKENAGLLPMLAGVLEITVFAAADRRRQDSSGTTVTLDKAGPSRLFKWVFLGLPSLAIAGFLLWQLRHLGSPLSYRSFTIGERLLTEARVLVRYLYLLVIPHGGTSGLYTSVRVSTGVLHPWTTLPAVLIIVSLVAAGFSFRRRWPVLSAAILFYFAGQLIESTTIPLELYYEHRNYLPAMLLFWPVALWVLRGPGPRWIRKGGIAALLLVLAALTAYRADLWGNGIELALTWMRLNPGSPRAMVWGSQALAVAGRPELALRQLRRASRAKPADVSIALSRLELACDTGSATESDLAAAVRAASQSNAGSRLIYSNVPRLAHRLRTRGCRPLKTVQLLSIPDAALRNPHFRGNPALRQEFLVLKGKLMLDLDRKTDAYAAFRRALPLNPKPDVALTTAAALLNAHAPELGLRLLHHYTSAHAPVHHGWTMARLHQWWLHHIGWYRESFRLMRKALHTELARSGASSS